MRTFLSHESYPCLFWHHIPLRLLSYSLTPMTILPTNPTWTHTYHCSKRPFQRSAVCMREDYEVNIISTRFSPVSGWHTFFKWWDKSCRHAVAALTNVYEFQMILKSHCSSIKVLCGAEMLPAHIQGAMLLKYLSYNMIGEFEPNSSKKVSAVQFKVSCVVIYIKCFLPKCVHFVMSA